jgi:hypothetical protein
MLLQEVFTAISKSEKLWKYWKAYKADNPYASEVQFDATVAALNTLRDLCSPALQHDIGTQKSAEHETLLGETADAQKEVDAHKAAHDKTSPSKRKETEI